MSIHCHVKTFQKLFPALPVHQNYLTVTPDLLLAVLACKTPRKKRSDRAVRKKGPENIIKTSYAQNRSPVQSSTVKTCQTKGGKTGLICSRDLSQDPLVGGREGSILDRSSVLWIQRQLTHSHTHNLKSTWPTCGWTVGGKQTIRREATQGGREHVNFTQKRSRWVFEPWTRPARFIWLLVTPDLVHCTHFLTLSAKVQ